MSQFSELLHGRKSLADIIAKYVKPLRDVLGQAVVHQGAEFVIDSAEQYKATVEAATRAYLEAHLGKAAGALAADAADVAINFLATSVEAAAHLAAGDQPESSQ